MRNIDDRIQDVTELFVEQKGHIISIRATLRREELRLRLMDDELCDLEEQRLAQKRAEQDEALAREAANIASRVRLHSRESTPDAPDKKKPG
jgi:hypothetical protein